jgi:uncharacterized protein (TIGR03435 family)
MTTMQQFSKLSICVALAWTGGLNILAGQSTDANATPQFEVASVKPAKLTGSPREQAMARIRHMMPPGSIAAPSPGRVHIQGQSLRDLVAAAYRVRADQVSGPAWMEELHFDIDAKIPDGATATQANEMLQALLADRFGLELHRENRELSGFALIVGRRGAKLEEFTPPPRPLTMEEMQARQQKWMEERASKQGLASSPFVAGRSRSSWTGITMKELAGRLTAMVGEPVADETGLTGKYNAAIETWRATDDDPGQTVFQALPKLGLELVRRKVPVEQLVIDKISRTPTGN